MSRIERRSLDDPDELRNWPLLTVNFLSLGSLSIGYGTVQPGWRWSTHMRKATDEPLCQVHHLQLLLSGRFAVQMEDGEYAEIEPRVMAIGGASDITVSSATRGLGEDRGLHFESRGVQHLKGLPNPLEVFALVD